jgi:hypothetical protein
MNDFRSKLPQGAGGTPGGLGTFLLGAAMLLVGGYLFFENLMVSSSFGALWGRNASAVPLLTVMVGIGILFFSGKSWLGWGLTAIGLGLIVINVISNLVIYFQPTSFFRTLLMLGLIAGGIGLIARALRPYS